MIILERVINADRLQLGEFWDTLFGKYVSQKVWAI
jgi:hypothetical protein